ncbi:hypothetical protein EMIT0P260_50245 [Pseudomonas sp. IT-P260]
MKQYFRKKSTGKKEVLLLSESYDRPKQLKF